jgi:hypothetical protein
MIIQKRAGMTTLENLLLEKIGQWIIFSQQQKSAKHNEQRHTGPARGIPEIANPPPETVQITCGTCAIGAAT